MIVIIFILRLQNNSDNDGRSMEGVRKALKLKQCAEIFLSAYWGSIEGRENINMQDLHCSLYSVHWSNQDEVGMFIFKLQQQESCI